MQLAPQTTALAGPARGEAESTPRGVGADTADIGIVVIGRNEGERLRRCLESVRRQARLVVYVDSGSTDGSVQLARAAGVEVVPLDMSTPFTASRARNTGFRHLQQIAPSMHYVQFVDGDCEIVDGWLRAAESFLEREPGVACVCGRLREQDAARSVYNRLCDMEWDKPSGETDACGGIAMMRCAPFAQAGGFREDLLAFEEADLCARLREQGLKIWRLPAPMALHDAAITRFAQWWMRTQRTGYGYAHSLWLHGPFGPERSLRRAMSAWVWAALLPLAVLLGVWAWGASALALLAAYPLQVLRGAARAQGRRRWRLARGFFILLGRFPELQGQFQFWFVRHPKYGSPPPSFDYKA